MSEKFLPIDQTLTMLAAAPPRIAALTSGLPPARMQTRPAPDEWSVNEVLAHLRSCADMWGGCIATMLAEEKPTLKAINPRTWIASTNYPELDFDASFDAFAQQRRELLAVLEPLSPEGWARTATVKGAGKPLERTVHFYAQWLARHERPHLKQIERVVRRLRK